MSLLDLPMSTSERRKEEKINDSMELILLRKVKRPKRHNQQIHMKERHAKKKKPND